MNRNNKYTERGISRNNERLGSIGQGFKIVREGIEEHTGHAELIMVYEV